MNGNLDFWYAVNHTKIVRAPSRALETFGATRVNYHLVAELEDDPRRIRVREGRLQANRPTLITPEAYAERNLEGFGEEAAAYLEFLRTHEDRVRILQYGFQLKQESFSEQVITDSMEAVLARVTEEVKASDDPYGVVIQGVDRPWDVCLVQFFWLHANASAPVNVREIEVARLREDGRGSVSVHADVEQAFSRAERDPKQVQALGALLQKRGLFERYQDRFFKLIRH